ncbi:hypothetical protein B0A49_09269 [Cryomyces minteri]|uniref:ERT1/acuK family PAS domain-containing protein n=1 Tax=Cryomyces minteri TaxID=331657 RepID=A0A4U0WG45_9PEZI|nr:hypothetical protein B0A49_09269 [Cryomyces minteri]
MRSVNALGRGTEHMTCDLERPCTRCLKRSIGHLCRDEPREPTKRGKSDAENMLSDEETSPQQEQTSPDESYTTFDHALDQQDADLTLAPPTLSQDTIVNTAPIVQPTPVSAARIQPLDSNGQSCKSYVDRLHEDVLKYNDWNFNPQNQFQDMHSLHPSYMFNTSETTNEYNLLNDFLSTSLLDDGALYTGDDAQALFPDPLTSMDPTSTFSNNSPALFAGYPQLNHNQGSSQLALGNAISRPASGFPIDKAREKYYMTAADPAGTDTPEERMNKLLKAKYDAGMLKPFNYVKGYARLNKYMERNVQPHSRMKILRQLDKFRPKFREAMHSLTDIQLVLVEMWFERTLMEYDRVFARNREMAELIHVPMEKLRDGKLAIHEVIAEDSLVNYWEKFGHIAFDNSQKAILTSCKLKNPDTNSRDPEIRCCFSFTIRRDTHNIPSLIVGNFLPILTSAKQR